MLIRMFAFTPGAAGPWKCARHLGATERREADAPADQAAVLVVHTSATPVDGLSTGGDCCAPFSRAVKAISVSPAAAAGRPGAHRRTSTWPGRARRESMVEAVSASDPSFTSPICPALLSTQDLFCPCRQNFALHAVASEDSDGPYRADSDDHSSVAPAHVLNVRVDTRPGRRHWGGRHDPIPNTALLPRSARGDAPPPCNGGWSGGARLCARHRFPACPCRRQSSERQAHHHHDAGEPIVRQLLWRAGVRARHAVPQCPRAETSCVRGQ